MKRDRLRACDLKIVYTSVEVLELQTVFSGRFLFIFVVFSHRTTFCIRFNKILIKCITIIIANGYTTENLLSLLSWLIMAATAATASNIANFARCKLKTTLDSKRRAKTIKALTCRNISPSEWLCSNALNSLLRYASWWCMCDNNPFSSFSLCITTAHRTTAHTHTAHTKEKEREIDREKKETIELS